MALDEDIARALLVIEARIAQGEARVGVLRAQLAACREKRRELQTMLRNLADAKKLRATLAKDQWPG